MSIPYKTLVILLEERSAMEMIDIIVKRLLKASVNTYENIDIQYMLFEGKEDLLKRSARNIREWQSPSACFLILIDQDSGDCKMLKESILKGIQAQNEQRNILVRVACRG